MHLHAIHRFSPVLKEQGKFTLELLASQSSGALISLYISLRPYSRRGRQTSDPIEGMNSSSSCQYPNGPTFHLPDHRFPIQHHLQPLRSLTTTSLTIPRTFSQMQSGTWKSRELTGRANPSPLNLSICLASFRYLYIEIIFPNVIIPVNKSPQNKNSIRSSGSTRILSQTHTIAITIKQLVISKKSGSFLT